MPPGSYLKPVTSGALAAGSWAERAHSPEGGSGCTSRGLSPPWRLGNCCVSTRADGPQSSQDPPLASCQSTHSPPSQANFRVSPP